MAPTADDAAGEQASGVILEEHYVVVVLGAFSMLGSAFIILSWLCRKPLRTASTLLIFCLAVSDFMYVGKFLATAALNLADDPAASTTGTTLCTVSGLIGQFFGEAAATWNAMLAINLWFMMQFPFRYKAKAWAWAYQAYVWGLAAITTLVIYLEGDIGASGDTTCWVLGSHNPMRLLFFVPLGFHWLLCIAVLLHLYCSSAIIKNELSSTKLRAAKRVAGFVVVFVVMWAPEAALRLVEWVTGGQSPTWLQVVNTCAVSLLGVSNAACWVWTLLNLWRRHKSRRHGSSRGHSSSRPRPMRSARGPRSSRGVSMHSPRSRHTDTRAAPLLGDDALQAEASWVSTTSVMSTDEEAGRVAKRDGAPGLVLPPGSKVNKAGFIQLDA